MIADQPITRSTVRASQPRTSNIVRQPPASDLSATECSVLGNLDATGNHYGITADRISPGVLLIATYQAEQQRLRLLFVVANDVTAPLVGVPKAEWPARIADLLRANGQAELADSIASFPTAVGVLRDDPINGPTPVAGLDL